MLNVKNIKTIIIKELKQQFDHIPGYLLVSLVLGLTYTIFLKAFFVNGIASMRDLFSFIYWPLSIFVPAVTMGTIASEKDKMTIEYLFTKPLTYAEILVGKVLGSATFCYLPILLTLPIVFFVKRIGNLDIGEVFASYLAALILVLSMTAIGVMVSSFFKNQISAFLSTAVIIFLLNFVGTEFFALNLPNFIAVLFSKLSIYDNYVSMVRGVYNVQNAVYFAIVITISYGIGYINLSKARLSNVSKYMQNTSMTIMLMILIGLAVFSGSKFIKGRLDLTSNKKYTLSQVTKDLLRSDGIVKIDVYTSGDLLPQYQNNLSELRNLLEDIKFVGGNNVQVQYFDASEQQAALEKLGIQPIQQQVISRDQATSNLVYFAVVVSDKDNTKQEKIAFVNDVNNIEYDLANIINKVKSKSKAKLGIAGDSAKYSALYQYLADTFEVSNINIPLKPATTEPVKGKAATEPDFNLDGLSALFVSSGNQEFTEKAKKKINDYYINGGKIIYLADTIAKSPQLSTITKLDANVGELFKDHGIIINKDIAYDTKSNVKINVPSGTQGTYVISYPPFIVAFKNDKSLLGQNIPENVIIPLTSSLDIKDDSWKIVFSTTDTGNTQDDADIKPGRKFATVNNKKVPLVGLKENDKGGKLIVFGSSMIFENEFVQNSPNNAIFASNLLEIFTSSINLTSIKSKGLVENRIERLSDFDKAGLNILAPVISVLILFVIAIYRILRRKFIRARFANIIT